MFKPNFHYTHNIVRNLASIAEARSIILTAPLVPKWEVSLRRDALLRSAHASTSIEGNPLSLEEVTALAEGREVMARRKDREEVLNYIEALEGIPKLAGKKILTASDVLDAHRIVTRNTRERPEDEGSFRKRKVVVENRITGEVVFTPPPP
ncbi:MAG: hypothetical protein NTX71_08210 [Candidatus Aureabacteria bacterium]|nr:hypothetical protein [Candidatus Auribacterota bacterium]